MSLLQMSNICKSFGGISVLKNVQLTVEKGEVHALLGENGAGKSTLMNMLSGKEKSIVTHIEGTTRDIVENSVRLGSLVLHLSDTAGLRESDDVVEAIGIKKALERIDTASLVLAVLIAFSRMYLYVHYPTDILGGVLVGLGAGAAGYYLVITLQERIGRRKKNGSDEL